MTEAISPPLCVWCGAPWTEDMLKVYVDGEFDFGYYPGEFSVDGYDATVEVTCSTCHKPVYRKEVRAYDPLPGESEFLSYKRTNSGKIKR